MLRVFNDPISAEVLGAREGNPTLDARLDGIDTSLGGKQQYHGVSD